MFDGFAFLVLLLFTTALRSVLLWHLSRSFLTETRELYHKQKPQKLFILFDVGDLKGVL